MPCRQVSTYNGRTGRGAFATEGDCVRACAEGACCEGTTCSVKPKCQCQGTGKTFKGVGTTCSQYNGACCTGTACAVVPECECVGTGKTFKGVGTTCANNICETCRACGDAVLPSTVALTISNFRNGPNALSESQMSTISSAIVGTHSLARSLPDVGGNAVYTTGSYDAVSSIGLQKWVYYPCDTGRHKTTGNSPLQIIYGEGGGAYQLRFGSGQFDLQLVNGQPVQFTSGSLCDASSTSRVGQVTSPQANTGSLVAYFDWSATPLLNPLP